MEDVCTKWDNQNKEGEKALLVLHSSGTMPALSSQDIVFL